MSIADKVLQSDAHEAAPSEPTELGAWIGGADHAPSTGQWIDTTDPVTLRPATKVARCGPADVDAAVAVAFAAQPPWAARSAVERSWTLLAIATTMRSHLGDLARAESVETGKPGAMARSEVEASAQYFEYFAGALQALNGRTIDHGDGELVLTRHEPYGVIGVITPWNGPLNQACRSIAPALAAGNAVVAKPSEFTSTTTVMLARLASEAGLPAGLLNVVPGLGPEVGTLIAQHPDVAKMVFTGSVRTGRVLGAIAAERIMPITLELGGKSALIVLADADIEGAASAAVSTMSANAGQVCSATTRVIVDRSIHDQLITEITARAEQLQPGVHFGPIITAPQYDRVKSWFETAAAEGAVAVLGGNVCTDEDGRPLGQYVQPTVYTNVDNGMRIARDEIFGPVIVVIPVDNAEEAVAVANDSDYGLGGAVWGGEAGRAIRVATQIATGQVSVNGGAFGNDTPFGGVKQSGHGREKGIEGLLEYCRTKSLSIRLPSV